MVAKLRTSSHNLQIEMGRRTRTEREKRLCVCGSVEDDDHFLVRCVLYGDICENFNVVQNVNVSDLSKDGLFVDYIYQLFEIK